MSVSASMNRTPWWIVFAAFVGLTLGPSVLLVLSFSLFVKPLEAEFGWSCADIGLGAALVSWMLVAVSPLQGYLIDRFGARRVILPSIPAFTAGLAAFALLPGKLWLFYVLCAVLPLLAIGLWPASYLKLVSGWFERHLGLAIGIANSGIGCGAALLPLVVGGFLATHGWRTTYFALAGVAFLGTFPVGLLLLREPTQGAGTSSSLRIASEGHRFDEALRTRELRLMIGSVFLVGLALTGVLTNHVPLLTDAGLSPQRAVEAQAVFGIAMLAGRLITGYLLDHYRAPRIMTVFLFAFAASCAIYAGSVPETLVFVAAVWVGLLAGAEFDVLSYAIRRYFGMRSFGKIYGVLFGVFQLGSGIGSASLAATRSFSGSYAAGLWAFAGITLIGALLFGRLGRYVYGLDGQRMA